MSFVFSMLRLGVLAGSSVFVLITEPFPFKFISEAFSCERTSVPIICSDVKTDAKLVMTEDREGQKIVI